VLDAPPAWWGDLPGEAAAVPMVPVAPIPVPATAPGEGSLAPAAASRAGRTTDPAWVEGLLGSSVYAAQRTLAGRMAPKDEQMRAVLAALDQFQGRAPRPALAAALGQPEIRLPGILAGVRRVLNVEGFPVIEEEEATGTVTLNRPLLARQFGFEG
jgi:hypothetical protein